MTEMHKQIIAQDFKGLNDDLIGDIIPLKIDAGMPVSTLHALETIFYLRLQLAQISWAENEPVYESLCRNRFEQIAQALIEKYTAVETISEKIMILYRLENISQTLHGRHSNFAVEERRKLLNSSELSFTQKYRLDNLLEFNYDNAKEDIDRLLTEARTAFDIAILFDIDTLGTEAQYDAVTDLFKTMFDRALAEENALGITKGSPRELAEGNTRELANLLAVAADTNNDPLRRTLLTSLIGELKNTRPTPDSINEGLINSGSTPCTDDDCNIFTLPESIANEIDGGIGKIECRANEIAAVIYDRIDTLTGKYLPDGPDNHYSPDGHYVPNGTYAPIPA